MGLRVVGMMGMVVEVMIRVGRFWWMSDLAVTMFVTRTGQAKLRRLGNLGVIQWVAGMVGSTSGWHCGWGDCGFWWRADGRNVRGSSWSR